MNKALIVLVAVILALGVAIYFFQGKIIEVSPAETSEGQTSQSNTEPPKVLPPSMETGTIDSSLSASTTIQ